MLVSLNIQYLIVIKKILIKNKLSIMITYLIFYFYANKKIIIIIPGRNLLKNFLVLTFWTPKNHKNFKNFHVKSLPHFYKRNNAVKRERMEELIFTGITPLKRMRSKIYSQVTPDFLQYTKVSIKIKLPQCS